MTNPSMFNPSASGDDLVTESRACTQCGYSLLGLPVGGVCPECGHPIPVAQRSYVKGDNLTDAPRPYLKMLSVALSGAAISALILGIGLVYLASQNFAVASLVLSAGSVLWFVSIWLVTRQRPRQKATVPDATLDNPYWLLTVRAVQISWIALAGSVLLFEVASTRGWTGWQSAAYWAMLLFSVVSVLVLVPLLIYLTSMALWAGDQGLGSRLRASAWAIGFCGPANVLLTLAAPHTGILIGLTSLFALVLGLFFMVGLVVTLISLAQLSAMSAWAIRNNAAIQARSIRMAQRRAEAMRETVDRQIAAVPAVPGGPSQAGAKPLATQTREIPVTDAQRASMGGFRLEPSHSDEIYELEPLDDD